MTIMEKIAAWVVMVIVGIIGIGFLYAIYLVVSLLVQAFHPVTYL